jgi:hypothetical protein
MPAPKSGLGYDAGGETSTRRVAHPHSHRLGGEPPRVVESEVDTSRAGLCIAVWHAQWASPRSKRSPAILQQLGTWG